MLEFNASFCEEIGYQVARMDLDFERNLSESQKLFPLS